MLSKENKCSADSGSSYKNLRMDHATSAISSRKESPPKRCEEVSWFPQFLYMEKHYVLIMSCLVAGVTQLEEYSDLL